jgi:hypothetical protein
VRGRLTHAALSPCTGLMNTHRRSVASLVAEARHLDQRGDPKTLTQIARETGTTRPTARRWLRRDHWDLWMEHWASVEEIWEVRGDAAPAGDQRTPRELREYLAHSLAEIEARGAPL